MVPIQVFVTNMSTPLELENASAPVELAITRMCTLKNAGDKNGSS